MVKKKVEIYFSKQGNLLFKNIKDIQIEELIDWFINIKKIRIGGGDIIDYLDWKSKGGKQ